VQQHALSQQQAEEQEWAAQLASDLQSQIKADADRRAAAVAASAPPRRPRANTDATEVPESLVGDTPIETFAERIDCDGVTFNSVKLFHPRRGASFP
jgi:translation initiation factor 2-alpha kinase 4